ncbi:MAG: alpha/beta hydrolase [Proteobacteria bacterium]|nr:alpha/beta hydrolase [Pseudomonadota bacterium]
MASFQRYLAGGMIRINRFFFNNSFVPDKYKRFLFDHFAPLFFTMPNSVRFESVIIDKISGEWIMPKNHVPDSVILYLHGGGFASGSNLSHRKMVARIAHAAKCRALVFNYRLTPEHTYPAALEDATDVYQWLLSLNYRPNKIVTVGDSAGGNLTMSLLLNLRENGIVLPAGAMLISPWTDLSLSGNSMKTKAFKDPMLSKWMAKKWARLYVGDMDPETPTISPIFADLRGLPPMLIQVGTSEILLDDSRRLADKARQDGVSVELEEWEKMFHVWHMFVHLMPESQKAVKRMGEYFNTLVSA